MRVLILLLSSVRVFAQCSDSGDAKTVFLRTLNTLKNREIIEKKIDTTITLKKILQSGNDTSRFSDTSYAEITGYCILAKWGEPETCNCKSKNKSDWDIHLVISENPAIQNQDSCMIVEITRKYSNRIFTPKDFVGHWLTIDGYMFRDDEHLKNSVNTAKTGTRDLFRKTANEIHPCTKVIIW